MKLISDELSAYHHHLGSKQAMKKKERKNNIKLCLHERNHFLPNFVLQDWKPAS